MSTDVATQAAAIPAPQTEQAAAVQVRPDRQYLWNMAKAMSASSLIPQHFRGKPGDCFIMADVAERLGTSLLATLQATYIVHGKPGFEGKFVAALLEGSGKIIGPIDYEFSGEGQDYGCSAIVEDAYLRKRVRGPKVTWKMVRAEGWDKKDGSKWLTMPDLMFHYRAAAFLVRTRYPSVLMGMNTRDELEEGTITTQGMRVQSHIEQARAARQQQEPTPAPDHPDATGGHAAVGDAAAREVEAGPSGTTPTVEEQGLTPGEAEWPYAGIDLSRWIDDFPDSYREQLHAAMDIDAIGYVRACAQKDKRISTRGSAAVVAACDAIIRAETGGRSVITTEARCQRCKKRTATASATNQHAWYCHHCRMEFEAVEDGDIAYGPPSRRIERQERRGKARNARWLLP